ncbi:MAG: Lsm family RNA-binding protein, partial [Candidatus Lokiarchaeota archaeon]|nr:Lsm family RNA-binding protein [Candidatus Lokiarchaeota archaeon]
MESRDAVGYNKEMNTMLESKVKVQLKNKDNFFVVGTLKGFSRTDSVFLINAEDTIGNKFNKLVIHGSNWISISLEGTPFPMEGLYQRLKNVFPPGQVKYMPDIQAISVMGKINVNEKGVTGEGPMFERVKTIYDQYIAEVNK